MEERDQTPPGWHDIPTADPQIQKDYEAALGAFLVTFNRIENTTNEIIHLALQASERQDILQLELIRFSGRFMSWVSCSVLVGLFEVDG